MIKSDKWTNYRLQRIGCSIFILKMFILWIIFSWKWDCIGVDVCARPLICSKGAYSFVFITFIQLSFFFFLFLLINLKLWYNHCIFQRSSSKISMFLILFVTEQKKLLFYFIFWFPGDPNGGIKSIRSFEMSVFNLLTPILIFISVWCVCVAFFLFYAFRSNTITICHFTVRRVSHE